LVCCCHSEDSWEETAADLSDVDAAAVNGVLSACGNDIDDHRASMVSGEHSTGVDPVSDLTDVAQAMLDIARVRYDLFLAITFNTSSLYQHFIRPQTQACLSATSAICSYRVSITEFPSHHC